MFSSEDWKRMDRDERVVALNDLERQEAIEQNRPPADVAGEEMASSENGYYDHNVNKIAINNEQLESDEPYDALRTYYHEERHAYQHDQVEKLEEGKTDNPEQTQEWKENFDNYDEPGSDFELYENQPVEQDARDHSTKKMLEYNQTQNEDETSDLDESIAKEDEIAQQGAEDFEAIESGEKKAYNPFNDTGSGGDTPTATGESVTDEMDYGIGT